MKIRAEDKWRIEKLYRKLMKSEIGSLKALTKLTNLGQNQRKGRGGKLQIIKFKMEVGTLVQILQK